jgi:hypothetical protein
MHIRTLRRGGRLGGTGHTLERGVEREQGDKGTP